MRGSVTAQRSQAVGIARGGMSPGQGAAAECPAPASVIAVVGGALTLCALAVAVSRPARPGWRRAASPETAAALTPAAEAGGSERPQEVRTHDPH